jgi:CHASE2 domain-containing sensor protein
MTTGLITVRAFSVLQDSELTAYDRFLRWQADEGPDDRLLVVGINEQDIQSRREDPIEDDTVADLLEALQEHNPRAIGIDLGRDIPQGTPAGRDRMLDLIQADPNIVMACLMSSPNFPGVPPPEGISPDQVGFADLPIDPKGTVRRALLFSIPEAPPLMPAGQHICNDSEPDFDLPSFSLLLAFIYLEGEGIEIGATESLDLVFGDRVIPTLSPSFGGYAGVELPPYQTMIHYRSPQDAVEIVGLSEVLAGEVPPELIEDRVVLIGYTSLVAKDLFITPYLAAQEYIREMPGVVVHAQIVSQLLATSLDGRPLIWGLPTLVEWIMIGLWGLGGGVLAYRMRRVSLFWLALGIASAGTWGVAYLAFLQGAWLPVVPTSLNLLLCAIAAVVVKQASRQGYTQALYELMKGQLQQEAEAAEAGQNDYLSALVTRAQTIRTGEKPRSASQPAIDMNHPEMQAILAEVRAQAEADLARQQTVEPDSQAAQQRGQRQQQKRLEALLTRSRQIRADLGTVQTAAPSSAQPEGQTTAVEPPASDSHHA